MGKKGIVKSIELKYILSVRVVVVSYVLHTKIKENNVLNKKLPPSDLSFFSQRFCWRQNQCTAPYNRCQASDNKLLLHRSYIHTHFHVDIYSYINIFVWIENAVMQEVKFKHVQSDAKNSPPTFRMQLSMLLNKIYSTSILFMHEWV